MKKDKCQAKDCNRMVEHPDESKYWFCSFECACYAGKFSMTKGWIIEEEETSKKDSFTEET